MSAVTLEKADLVSTHLNYLCVCVCVFHATEQFQEKVISYQQFSENPSVIDDPNLVVKIGNKYVLLD